MSLSVRPLWMFLFVLFPLTLWAQEPEEGAAGPPADTRSADFVKGELSSLGAQKLILQDTRVGLRGGLSQIGPVYYVLGSLEFDLRKGRFGLGLGIPMQIPLYDPSAGLTLFPEGIDFRRQDYDELSELARVIRYLTFGKKEDELFLNLSSENAATLGHGAAIRRYLANVDVDRGRLSAQFDAYGKYGGVETVVGDVLQPHRMLGALAFVRPLGGSRLLPLRNLSLGLTWAADFKAPWMLKRDVNGLPVLEGEAGRTQVPVAEETRVAQIFGLSLETKVVRTDHVDLKPYLELSKLWGGGGGLSLGLLGRFNFDLVFRQAVRAIAELRVFEGNYLPGYFDTFYEVQRYQYITGQADAHRDQTKLFDVLNRSSERHLGYYLELQYAALDFFALTAAWEDSPAKGGRNLVLHGEIPFNQYLRGFVSAHRRSVEGRVMELGKEPIGGLFRADNSLFFAGARIKVLPILYLNMRLFRAWQMDPQPQSFRNVDGFEIDVELGYEFSLNR